MQFRKSENHLRSSTSTAIGYRNLVNNVVGELADALVHNCHSRPSFPDRIDLLHCIPLCAI